MATMRQESKSDKSLGFLPWGGEAGNLMCLPWRPHDSTREIEIVNASGHVLTRTKMTDETRPVIRALNNYAIEVMNVTAHVRGEGGLFEGATRHVCWDYACAEQVRTIHKAFRLLNKYWAIFEDKEWAEPLRPFMENKVDDNVIALSAQEKMGIGVKGDAVEKKFVIQSGSSFSLPITVPDMPFVVIEPIPMVGHMLIANRQRDFVESRLITEQLDIATYNREDVSEAELKNAGKWRQAAESLRDETIENNRDEIRARNAAFKGVIVPTLNAFLKWKHPEAFPAVVGALSQGIEDFRGFARAMAGFDDRVSDKFKNAADKVTKALAVLAAPEDRNRALLEMSGPQRQAIYDRLRDGKAKQKRGAPMQSSLSA